MKQVAQYIENERLKNDITLFISLNFRVLRKVFQKSFSSNSFHSLFGFVLLTLNTLNTLTKADTAISPSLSKNTSSKEWVLEPQLAEFYRKMKSDEQDAKILSKILPRQDELQGSSGQDVVQKMADRATQYFFDSPNVRNSSMGQVALDFQSRTKRELKYKVNDKSNIEHRFIFQMLPFQNLARIDYHGFTNARLSICRDRYQNLGIEIYEKLFKSSEVSLHHQQRTDQMVSSIDLKWMW